MKCAAKNIERDGKNSYRISNEYISRIALINCCGSSPFALQIHLSASDLNWIWTPIDQTLWLLTRPSFQRARAIFISN